MINVSGKNAKKIITDRERYCANVIGEELAKDAMEDQTKLVRTLIETPMQEVHVIPGLSVDIRSPTISKQRIRTATFFNVPNFIARMNYFHKQGEEARRTNKVPEKPIQDSIAVLCDVPCNDGLFESNGPNKMNTLAVLHEGNNEMAALIKIAQIPENMMEDMKMKSSTANVDGMSSSPRMDSDASKEVGITDMVTKTVDRGKKEKSNEKLTPGRSGQNELLKDLEAKTEALVNACSTLYNEIVYMPIEQIDREKNIDGI